MKLIGSLTSPFARKVRVALIEKNLPYEFVNDQPWDADTQVPKFNPLGKVPALVLDSGETLFDSNVLIEYLELLDATPVLLPRDATQVLRVRQLVALADGIMEAGIAMLLEDRRPVEIQHAPWVERQRGKIERGLDALALLLGHKTWLHGDALSAADVAAGCMLLWLDFRQPDNPWRRNLPVLSVYADRLAARESFKQTVPVL